MKKLLLVAALAAVGMPFAGCHHHRHHSDQRSRHEIHQAGDCRGPECHNRGSEGCGPEGRGPGSENGPRPR